MRHLVYLVELALLCFIAYLLWNLNATKVEKPQAQKVWIYDSSKLKWEI